MKIDETIKTVAVMGLGYVGLPLAIRANKSFNVIGFDINSSLVGDLNKGFSHIPDVKIKHSTTAFERVFTTNKNVLKDADAIIVCVPTPVDENNLPNLEPLVHAVRLAGEHIKSRALLIIESTINPGVCDETIIPILERYGKILNIDYDLAHCPERINPGDSKWNIGNINRVVGGSSPKATERAATFYESFIDAEITRMGSLMEAEAVKIVENSFRDINIAFVNELAKSFDNIGLDVVNVIDGAATKPFGFMAHYPGVGVGGHCIPVDPYYLIEYAKKQGFKHVFLENARQINKSMPEFTASLLIKQLSKLSRKKPAKVLVLGLAYKPNLSDYRESPSFDLIHELIAAGMTVDVFDPFISTSRALAINHLPKRLNKSRESTNSLAEDIDVTNWHKKLNEVDAVVIATAHTEFIEASQLLNNSKSIKVIIDARNCLNKSDFVDNRIIYKGIGR